jgi:hypothetical protein
MGLKAKIARMIWNKETIGGIDVDIALRGDTLRLNDVKVSNLAGAQRGPTSPSTSRRRTWTAC